MGNSESDAAVAWKARYDSMVQNLSNMEAKVLRAQNDVKLMEAQKRQWEIEKVNQTAIIQQQIEVLNRTNQEQAEEIMRLRQILRDAGLGVN
jgi:hypothetical protein